MQMGKTKQRKYGLHHMQGNRERHASAEDWLYVLNLCMCKPSNPPGKSRKAQSHVHVDQNNNKRTAQKHHLLQTKCLSLVDRSKTILQLTRVNVSYLP